MLIILALSQTIQYHYHLRNHLQVMGSKFLRIVNFKETKRVRSSKSRKERRPESLCYFSPPAPTRQMLKPPTQPRVLNAITGANITRAGRDYKIEPFD